VRRSLTTSAGFRGFGLTRLGKLVLLAISIAVLAATFYYLGPYFAIPAFVLFGLGVPIYAGWKIPRELALAGVVALLVAAPIVNYGLTSQAMVPSGAVMSGTNGTSSGTGNPVLTNAIASPYSGPGGSSFTFSVDVSPNNLPAKYLPDLLFVYVSTCPGVTGPSSPNCPSGYPFYTANLSMVGVNASPTPETFHLALPGPNIWWWQMALLAESPFFNSTANRTEYNYDYIGLNANNIYGSVQGPIAGNFVTTFDLLLPQTIIELLFYPGLVFFVALLIYMFLKSREARRKAQRDRTGSASLPPTTGAPPDAPSTVDVPSDAPRRNESACPKCGAVVYPGETSCWKCGSPLPSTGAAPLPSSRS
jgi:hypothetical protein